MLIILNRAFIWPASIGFAILFILWFLVNPLQDKIFTEEESHLFLGILAAMFFFLVAGLCLGNHTKYGQAIPFVEVIKPGSECLTIRVLGEGLFLTRFKNGDQRIVFIPPGTPHIEEIKVGTVFTHDGKTLIVRAHEV